MAGDKKKEVRKGKSPVRPSTGAKGKAQVTKDIGQVDGSAPAHTARSRPVKARAAASQCPSFVVGIGASAGGLETFENFFKMMPTDSGMAFILVTHLEPMHVSMLPELLQKSTAMPVQQACDGMAVQPNQIYIIPPDHDLGLMNGTMQLFRQQKSSTPRAPINYFFRSLALDQREKAIGIILSGMGSDGALGIKVIKEELGMVMAQEPSSAKFAGMPESAIATGLVDYVLPPEKMPDKLGQYARFGLRPEGQEPALMTKSPDGLNKIFFLIRSVTGHDLSSYKRSTIMRRLERRMKVHQIEKLPQYIRYLQANRHEVEALFKEILINVTSFFRDAEAFKALEERALPQLLGGHADEDAVRIWTPGCASGEEAYSLAILLREYMEEHGRHFKVQIFGTDIDDDAIETARAGIYPAAVAADIGPERLGRFFDRENSGYRIKKEIREMLIFAPQDLIKDPPFTKLDLVCCRNLLIYLDGDLQKKLLPLFHYSLKPNGVLFLGSSESVGEFVDLFAVVDKKWRIFTRKGGASSERPMLEIPLGMPREGGEGALRRSKEFSLSQFVEKTLLEQYAPPCIVINAKGNILYIHGRTGKFLEPAPGNANMNIIDMAREGLKMQLPSAIRRAVTQKKEVVYEKLRVRTNGGFEPVTLTVRPVTEPEPMEGLLLVLLEELKTSAPAEVEHEVATHSKKSAKRIVDLEQELTATRENLQTTIEELETSNEELKSMNEEYQSTNEELKSANEELETSREELQSLNEELTTVNAELQEKIERLSRSHRDIKDYLDGIEIPTIFLDNDMRIKRFNTHAGQIIINLIESDIGRPIGHIVTKLKYDKLSEDAGEVQRTLRPLERRIETQDGHWYLMRILPYRTSENVLDGVVITFINIDEIVRLVQAQNPEPPDRMPQTRDGVK